MKVLTKTARAAQFRARRETAWGAMCETWTQGQHRPRVRWETVDGECMSVRVCVEGKRLIFRFANRAVTHGKIMDFQETPKERHLLVMPSADKGVECWLLADGELFPHESEKCKYWRVAQRIMAGMLIGR